VGVEGFSLMDNHLHLLLKVDTASAYEWSDREVVSRWLGLHPPRDGYRRRVDVQDEHVDAVLEDPAPGLIESLREKLTSISQFMKELKQEVSQEINRLEDSVGSLWAGRFKSKAVVDETQLLTTLAYIDLNPFAAGVCDTPEAGEHTSLAARLHGVEEAATEIEAAKNDKPQTKVSPPHPEKQGWWMPLDDGQPGAAQIRRTLLPGTTLTFERYLKLLDRVSRLLRKGKRTLATDARPVLQRLAMTPSGVANTLEQWFKEGLPWDRPRAAR